MRAIWEAIPWDWADPLHGVGYAFWSGIGLAPIVGAYSYWNRKTCHEPGCRRRVWHSHPVNGHLLCRRHHPHGQKLPDTTNGAREDAARTADPAEI